MFEKLKLLWTEDAPLTEEYRQFNEMLRLNKTMFNKLTEAIISCTDVSAMEADIYDTDIQINKLERSIRKQMVVHLSLTGCHDVGGALTLMSIVKDAERLGDLCKNLLEIADANTMNLKDYKFYADLEKYAAYVNQCMDSTIAAFDNEDTYVASEIVKDEVKWNKRFDRSLSTLIKSDVSTMEAVTTTMMLRTFKRFQAHLANISSSIVLPVHRIDHRPKNLREDSDNSN